MPWCDECDRFLSPSTVRADGTCPTCGRIVDPGHAHTPVVQTEPPDGALDPEDETFGIPWHLKLLAGALAVYLGWRAFQGLEWVVYQF